MTRIVSLVLCFLLVPPVAAQTTRFELGQRLRLFEQALEKNSGEKVRKRTLAALEKATFSFFGGKQNEAAGLLDRARLALASDKAPDDAILWAQAIMVHPSARAITTGEKSLALKASLLYKAGAKPDKVSLRWSLLDDKGKTLAGPTTVVVKELPLKLKADISKVTQGDRLLRVEVLIDGKSTATSEQILSIIDKLGDRLKALRKASDALPSTPATTEKATLKKLIAIVEELRDGKTLETNFPAARFVVEAEAVLKAIRAKKPYYGSQQSGHFWLALATEGAIDHVRVQIPPEASKGKKLPLVIAMHGAGGSENMFFDGYGDGKVAKLAAKRGWLLVTTRTGLFGGRADPARVVDALAKIYPVDVKKVFLVGHSMGASQAVAAAGRKPDRFAAVAALGGGGGFAKGAKISELPFFVGVGEKDFALRGAKTLHANLLKAGVKKATLKVYPSVEHLIVVQLALEDVFAMFDGVVKK